MTQYVKGCFEYKNSLNYVEENLEIIAYYDRKPLRK